MKSKSDIITFLAVFVYLIIATKGLNFIGWSLIVPTSFEYAIELILLAVPFVYFGSIRRVPRPIAIIVSGLFFLPLISIAMKLLLGAGETLNIEMVYTVNGLASFAFFYMFWKHKSSEKAILNAIVTIGVITFFLQVYQQFNNDVILFADLTAEDDIEKMVRNGIYRLGVGSWSIALFCMYYYWAKVISGRFKLVDVILFVVFVVSVYMYLSRQIIIAVLITFVLSLMSQREKKHFGPTLFVVVAFVVLIAINFDAIFGSLIELTQENDYSHGIRFEFISYILGLFPKDPIFLIFGHGGYSIIEKSWEGMHYFLSDIGFVGATWKYGLLYLFIYFLTLYVVLVKYRKILSQPIQLYIFSTMINSLFIFPYRYGPETFIWTYILYVTALEIRTTNLQRHEVQRNNTSVQGALS